MRLALPLVSLAILLSSCHRVGHEIHPQMVCPVSSYYLKHLPSPFPEFTSEEKQTEWGRELLIGTRFAKEGDFYRALTALKRAEFLQPTSPLRSMQTAYDTLFCYYLGGKQTDVLNTYAAYSFLLTRGNFPAAEDLKIILYDCYKTDEDEKKATSILETLRATHPELASKLQLSSALKEGDLNFLKKQDDPLIASQLEYYDEEKKSVGKAQVMNALLPGAGYLYIGQKQSALTAFLLNGLFIGATYYFFHHHNVPAGAIFASFEAGWYFGGIYGVGLEAKNYNERLYEKTFSPTIASQGLCPALMLTYGF